MRSLHRGHAATFTTGEDGLGWSGGGRQGVHRLIELRVNIPGIGGVNFRLQLAHFFHERVKSASGLSSLRRSR